MASTVVPVVSHALRRVFWCARMGVVMPPRPGIEPGDLVTPRQAAELLDIPVGTVSSWINRYGIEPIGRLGRWNVYDYREIAVIDARKRRQEAA